jgi:uncharacterized protein YprB with RNaseH-like and TPR domain
MKTASQMDSLSDKLKKLGVRQGTQDLKPSPRRTTFPIEDLIPGNFIHAKAGSIYLVENKYPRQHQHGTTNLELSGSLRIIAEWAGHPEIAVTRPEEIAFLDTETSGLSGGTGTFAFMVGVGLYQEGSFHIEQFFMGDPLDEPALLLAIEEYLAPCKVLVTYNGKSFDVPILNSRYILHGWHSPLSNLLQLDLLHLARKLWRFRLPRRSLSDIETQILKTMRTEEEVPGWMIPQMYFDYLRSRDARPMKRVFYHNEIDVLSLAALLNHSSLLIEELHEQYVQPIDRYSIARLYEDLGHQETAINIYWECIQDDLPEEFHLDAIQHLSFIFKRRQDYLNAVELWEKAAAKEQVYAFIELAKYYEHTSKDYAQALHWTETAINLVKSPDFPVHQRYPWVNDLEHRYQRLNNKLKRA